MTTKKVSYRGVKANLPENVSIKAFKDVVEACSGFEQVVQPMLDVLSKKLHGQAELLQQQRPSFSFHIGNVQVQANNINEIRDYVEELKPQPGDELCNAISDFIFDVEITYQKYHNLNEDDYSIVHKK